MNAYPVLFFLSVGMNLYAAAYILGQRNSLRAIESASNSSKKTIKDTIIIIETMKNLISELRVHYKNEIQKYSDIAKECDHSKSVSVSESAVTPVTAPITAAASTVEPVATIIHSIVTNVEPPADSTLDAKSESPQDKTTTAV
jgi:hypothetical protein